MIGIRDRLSEIDEEILCADGFDAAIIGYTSGCGEPLRVVYDADKCISILMDRDGMDYHEAVEYFTFNTEGAYVGKRTPLFMWNID